MALSEKQNFKETEQDIIITWFSFVLSAPPADGTGDAGHREDAHFRGQPHGQLLPQPRRDGHRQAEDVPDDPQPLLRQHSHTPHGRLAPLHPLRRHPVPNDAHSEWDLESPKDESWNC
ncbi:hypothetical protein CEXT_699341 [Caerostris extrusa]|uniref:Uncharacterized protein n=1 Tax=Caerostris extrusa TaxID=172846 RepID=A0AAV4SMX4_CAEEX|nr:hypothetical protein CEXT_699341 [Caerostris extrusa]